MNNSFERPKSVEDLPLIFGIAELCVILNISKNTALELVTKPGFPKSRVGRKYIIGKQRFIEWLDQQMQNDM